MPEVYTHTQGEHYLSVLIAVNGIVQLLLDIVLEALHVVPTRINHLALTILNAFLAWKTLSAIQKDKFRFLHEDCQVLFLLELFLIAGDIYYIIFDEFSYTFIWARLFFLVCSTFNFVAVIYIMRKYGLWSLSYQGDIVDKEDDDDDQTISLFYRSSNMNDEGNKNLKSRSTSNPTTTTSPMASVLEEELERNSERISENSKL